jgi:hypothetical protein
MTTRSATKNSSPESNIRSETFEELWARSRREHQRARDLVAAALNKPLPRLQGTTSSGVTYLLTRSTYGKPLRVTYIVNGKPTGHSEYGDSERDLAAIAREFFFLVHDPTPTIIRKNP